MALYPAAKHLLIAPGSNDPRIKPRVAVLHVDAGGAASLFSYFRYRSGGIESHFHVTWTGAVEQYRDTNFQADANHLANDFGISIETQGFGGGKWNRRQLKAIKALLLWLHETHDIPLRKVDRWDGSGVGYHVQFGAPGPWTPVAKSCPGPERIKQYEADLVPWMATALDPTEEAPVGIGKELRNWRLFGSKGDNRTYPDVLRNLDASATTQAAALEQIAADVAAIKARLEAGDTPAPK